MADAPQPVAAPMVPASDAADPVIYTIPDKFYGAALRARVMEVEKPKVEGEKGMTQDVKPVGRGWLIPGVVGMVILVGVASGFVYFNSDLLFGSDQKPTPPPVKEQPAPPPPPALPDTPTNVTASATAPTAVAVTWTDVATNEAGFRVDRRSSASAYAPLTSLPPNTTTFLDVSAQPSTSYLYRIVAINSAGESPVSNEAAAETPDLPPPPPEQAKLPPAGLDSDSDGLTDLEEPLYGSPTRDPDADKDSFLDGNEVFHLYNPSGKAPVRLLESGLVKPFESPTGWRLFVPASWQVRLEQNGLKGTVLTGHGEMFTLTVEDNPERQSLLTWYLAKNPGVLSSQVANIRTTGGYEGLEGADLLTTLFVLGDKILVFRYELDDQPFVNYRTTYEMMKNSLFLPPVAASAEPPTAPATATSTFSPVVPDTSTSLNQPATSTP